MTHIRRIDLELNDEVNMGNLENVRRLLQEGADPNGRNSWGQTPLMAAAYTGQTEMVRLLLDSGADGTLTDRDGRTAQQLAARFGHEGVLAVFSEDGSCSA